MIEKQVRQDKIGMSPTEQNWNHSYLEQVKKQDEILNTKLQSIKTGKRMGITPFEDAKGIINLADAPNQKAIKF